jgi:tetratricopeptide (TPR) repeat protein
LMSVWEQLHSFHMIIKDVDQLLRQGYQRRMRAIPKGKPALPPSQRSPGGPCADGLLKCVFSSESVTRIGTGVTARKQSTKSFWYVEQKDSDRFDISRISPEFMPLAREKILTREELLAEYTPEVELYHQKVEPAIRAVQKIVARADRHRGRGESFSAEMEYHNALKLDSENVRATFGLGLIYLERDEQNKSESVFRTLLRMEAAFEEEHKHLFNEFGISLRKNGLFNEAVEYYRRAKTICPTDEHLEFNLARAYYELDEYAGCLHALVDCLLIDARMAEAESMARHLLRLSENESLRTAQSKPDVLERLGPRGTEILSQLKRTLASGKERKAQMLQLRDLLSNT